MLYFINDYSEGAHPKILEALAKTNNEHLLGYGADEYTQSAKKKICAFLGKDIDDIYMISGGTQTNKVVIGTMLENYEGVIAAVTGHVSIHEAGAIEAAKEARKEGIQIFVLSVGTEQGGPIPMSDGTYKRDLSGNVVTTKLNEQIGKNIAQAGGGMYVHVDQTNLAQSLLEKEIEKMQKEDISQSMYSEYDEQFVAVALLLFIVLVVELCIMERQNHVFTKFKLFK